MKKTIFTGAGITALLVFIVMAFSGCDPDATYTTIYVVRHAEVHYPPGENNPHLLPEGEVRAEALADKFGSSTFAAVYVTEKHRTRETASPTLAALSMDSTEINDGLNQDLVDHVLTNHSGKAVLIVNHSHNIEDILVRFHAKNPFPGAASYPGDDYDKLFTLIHTHKEGVRDTSVIVETTYGAVSP